MNEGPPLGDNSWSHIRLCTLGGWAILTLHPYHHVFGIMKNFMTGSNIRRNELQLMVTLLKITSCVSPI